MGILVIGIVSGFVFAMFCDIRKSRRAEERAGKRIGIEEGRPDAGAAGKEVAAAPAVTIDRYQDYLLGYFNNPTPQGSDDVRALLADKDAVFKESARALYVAYLCVLIKNGTAIDEAKYKGIREASTVLGINRDEHILGGRFTYSMIDSVLRGRYALKCLDERGKVVRFEDHGCINNLKKTEVIYYIGRAKFGKYDTVRHHSYRGNAPQKMMGLKDKSAASRGILGKGEILTVSDSGFLCITSARIMFSGSKRSYYCLPDRLKQFTVADNVLFLSWGKAKRPRPFKIDAGSPEEHEFVLQIIANLKEKIPMLVVKEY